MSTAEETTRKVHRLTSDNEFKLWKAVEASVTRFDTLGVSDEQAAVLLSEELGFQINDNHVKGARKVTGVNWGRKRGRHSKGKSSDKANSPDRPRIVAKGVEEFVGWTSSQISEMSLILLGLCRELGARAGEEKVRNLMTQVFVLSEGVKKIAKGRVAPSESSNGKA